MECVHRHIITSYVSYIQSAWMSYMAAMKHGCSASGSTYKSSHHLNGFTYIMLVMSSESRLAGVSDIPIINA